MKRREVKGPPSTDLLVCFPTRSHLALLPKPICSPSRSLNSHNHRHPCHHHHHRGKSIGGGGGDGDGGLWSTTKMESELSEPTSPKVTCAGQIKVQPKAGPCKNWESVMEEIERLRNKKKHRKKPTWIEALGFKKEAMQALTCLRSFKFDLGCFGAFPNANLTSDDEDEEYEDQIDHEKKLMGLGGFHDHHHDRQDLDDHDHDQNQDVDDDHKEGSSRSAFSKWFMVLEENQDCGLLEKEQFEMPVDDDQEDAQDPSVPPSNALLLMRCRSAPTKSSLEEKEEEDDDDGEDDDDEHDDGKRRENLMELMKYESDFYKLSCDIAKETWVVGGINKDSFSRTQSSKRCSIRRLQEVKACLR